MKTRFILIINVLLLLSLKAVSQAEKPKQNPREDKFIFWGYPENYLNHQTEESFDVIDSVLKIYKPEENLSLNRQMALTYLDVLLHDTRNDKSLYFYDFVNSRINFMLNDLKEPVKKGVRIFKLYNDAFILKTKSATVAIDFISGGPENQPFINDSLIYQIANQCDALFITHAHGDHANLRIAKIFASQGKRVVVPKDLWTGVDPLIQQLLHADTVVNVPFDDIELNVKILPGHQDEMYNNIYVFNFKEGFSVAHTGDQYNKNDLEWIANIKNDNKIDVLLVNCWTLNLPAVIEGFNPKMVITGHENEMEHSIDHREAYWMTMKKMTPINIRYVMMTWGENYTFKK